ncbi:MULTISPECIES: low specificity L-threonine aldolase [Exiguobacterium]|uniref:Aminotransferase class I/II-fold pyridoxal phosphate-dependent enzyme n=1 Tax=Exiguobacterium antarcticum TaxID=132920 RepID=A0ABT6R2M7_9BACL|nr:MULTISPECIES: aminotransferase class I/II-fold pyridoxal phosphate-dependent enzyme [Exiguobacterium]AFS70421.1 Aromatic amino acid beta-eliminating lyase/threonine aldolase [Exiguobacterium antarcticum B7]MCT4781230.1 aminotransferase class I/II-fold pyridoxal phosphate-dependent enzyme [Exiguobacterium soli]MDI3235191.1 aminotransferase class I/II-fold pyridoxal phosphate-dependent enzyme [Exiguobacterium antarcticum]
MSRLRTTFQQSTGQVSGHGKRNVGVLTAAFAAIEDGRSSDQYGTGPFIEPFEQKMADLLGMEEAVFFPSGTMAQQIALRIWSDETGNRTVAYHPLCHLEIHEQDGLKELHPIQTLLVGEADRLMTLDEIKALPEIACLLLELPQREIGGVAPTFTELEAISRHCRERGIRLHLDGARLFEMLPYYQKTAAEIAALFDSVYISFYKGLGGIAGAILAGPAAFCQTARIWKRRYGGDLISLYPYIVSADHYYELRKDRMGQYYENAKQLAERFNALPGVFTTPEVPVSNMFHLHFSGQSDEVSPKLEQIQETTGIGLVGYLVDKDGYCSTEISLGDAYGKLATDRLNEVFEQLDQMFS